ncbi:MAG: NADPH-dependent 7-cyano-7-deazaguanine reductase QueF [Candidatus Hydrogenedentes bacterium]|nr:NADPH-dependent 7-cyano-7-deazaguanine reductase QueF [Candidatus Hydrogenedentota bacterium]
MNQEPRTDARAQFKALDRTLPFQDPDTVDPAILECFPYEYADTPHGAAMEVVIETEEFTSVCPFSGLPDFASLSIRYVPDRSCIELRSLKYYLLTYRSVGIWYEHLVNKLLEDLARCARPRRMSVTLHCKPRGGLVSTLTAAYDRETMGPPEALGGAPR